MRERPRRHAKITPSIGGLTNESALNTTYIGRGEESQGKENQVHESGRGGRSPADGL